MPLPKRTISPVHVSRHRLPTNIKRDELECVANGTLANLVRELSSLSRHAEDVFGELYHEAMKIEHRTNTLATRMDRLAMKVTKLDSNEEDTSLQDIGLRKPYKSNALVDQQSLSRQTLPAAMTECYSACDTPPDLDALNVFREDGRSGLKFYTDPEYFFELWRQEMLKSGDKKAKQPKAQVSTSTDAAQQQRRNKRVRQPRDTREELVNRVISKFPEEYQTPEFMRQAQAARAAQFGGPQQYSPHIPAGMVRPDQYDQQNGHYAVANNNQQQQQMYASSSTTSTQHANVQQSYSNMAVQQPIYGHVQQPRQQHVDNNAMYTQFNRQPQQQQQVPQHQSHAGQYYEQQNQHELYTGYQPPNHNHNQSAEHSTASTSSTPRPQQYTNQYIPNDATNMPQSPSAASDLSNRSRGSTPQGQRPAHAPPAPPPLSAGGNSGSDMNGMRAQISHMRVSDRADSPDFPPPPPALMSQSIMSNNAEMPEPPPELMNNLNQGPPVAPPLPPGGNIPPAPPPPPPMSHFAAPMQSIPAGNNPSKPVHKSKPKAAASEPQAELLAAIRDGIKLRKLERQDDRQREQSAAQSQGHDVAAILRKRMQDVMGQDDSDEEEDDEYKEDWED